MSIYVRHYTAQQKKEYLIGQLREAENEFNRRGYTIRACLQCMKWKPIEDFMKGGKSSKYCNDCSNKSKPTVGMSVLRSRVLSSLKRAFKEYRNMEPPDITLSYMENLFIEQNGLCALTGRRLILEKGIDAISIDRIDSTKGYVKGNVRWTTRQANIAKSNYTDTEFLELCRDVLIKKCFEEGKEVKIVPF
jgi:hypothetical protein